MKQAKDLCPTATKKRTELGAWILDLRDQEDVNQFRFDVANYISIPLKQLENRQNELPKGERIICVCDNPSNATLAAQYLLNQGFEKVYYMRRSVVKWLAKGFPVIGDVSKDTEQTSCGCSH